jgi:hypothetical protein
MRSPPTSQETLPFEFSLLLLLAASFPSPYLSSSSDTVMHSALSTFLGTFPFAPLGLTDKSQLLLSIFLLSFFRV